MEEKWVDRFKKWLCRILGHSVDVSESWEHGGMTHYYCNNCNSIVSRKTEK